VAEKRVSRFLNSFASVEAAPAANKVAAARKQCVSGTPL
jgi:hypothetical protein